MEYVWELIRLIWPFVAIFLVMKLGRRLVKDWIPAIKLWLNERTM